MVWNTLDRTQSSDYAQQPRMDDEMKKQILDLVPRCPVKQAVLLEALHLVQQRYRHIPETIMLEIAQLLDITPAVALDTVSFYDLFSSQPLGRHLIGICQSLSCELCGCESVLQAIQDKLQIEPGQTTPDEKFTLITMQCLGLCDFAPAMLIDGRAYKNVTVEQLDDIFNQLD